MQLPTILQRGKLIRRYKRFLADVELETGEVIVAHCPNPGSMQGCAEPGSAVLLRHSNDPKRKLPYTWVMTIADDVHINVDTLLANKLVHEALKQKQLPELEMYDQIIPEYKSGDSRFDFMLTASGGNAKPCLVEVKSTTLTKGDCAMFPDAVTARGRKHLGGLSDAVNRGMRAVQFYCIARNDVRAFAPAEHIDPEYARALRAAAAQGVELMAWTTEITLTENRHRVRLNHPVPIHLT